MRKSLSTSLAYSAAWLTIALAFLVPFVVMNFFSHAVARAGLRIDSIYTGGELARTRQRNGYQISINQPVRPRWLQSGDAFVQLAWSPLKALPTSVSEDVDVDGDGQPDIHVAFAVPADPKASLHADVTSLNSGYRSVQGMSKESFSQLIVRTDDSVVVRVPFTSGR
jgi:hypothetical protein